MIDASYLNDRRGWGVVRYETFGDPAAGLDAALARFGLKPDAALLVEIDGAEAAALLADLLCKDMAYGVTGMSEEDAHALARQILGEHAYPECRYYTNRTPAKSIGGARPFNMASWNPMTDATFDAGIVITAPGGSYACVWFEDED